MIVACDTDTESLYGLAMALGIKNTELAKKQAALYLSLGIKMTKADAEEELAEFIFKGDDFIVRRGQLFAFKGEEPFSQGMLNLGYLEGYVSISGVHTGCSTRKKR